MTWTSVYIENPLSHLGCCTLCLGQCIRLGEVFTHLSIPSGSKESVLKDCNTWIEMRGVQWGQKFVIDMVGSLVDLKWGSWLGWLVKG